MIDTRSFFEEGQAALVVIDLQRGIAARDVKPHFAHSVVANAAKLADAARKADVAVVWVRVSYGPGARTMLRPIVDNPAPAPAFTDGWDELVPELGARESDLVVTKRNWGAFYGTDLDLHLRRRGVERIAICGISTSIGVESTARDAFERNYKLLFVEDAMAAMSEEEHRHSCSAIFPRMGIVRSTQDVLDAVHPPPRA